jgi:5'-phosphate synthase pdxT subunit
MDIGVLALQGDFAKHGAMLDRLGARWREVRASADLAELNGIIIPGGESTTILRLLRDENLFEPLKKFVHNNPSFGTCAGAILLAREVHNPAQPSLNAIDIAIERNCYGRQIHSFTEKVSASSFGAEPLEMVFIRAPGISSVGPSVLVLAQHQGRPVLVNQGYCLAATFHPELTEDTRVHKFFLSIVERYAETQAASQ